MPLRDMRQYNVPIIGEASKNGLEKLMPMGFVLLSFSFVA